MMIVEDVVNKGGSMSKNEMVLVDNPTVLGIQKKLQEHDDRFDEVDAKLENHDRRFDEIDERFDSIDQRLEDLAEVKIIVKKIQKVLLDKMG